MQLPDIFAGLGQRRIQEALQHFRVVDVDAGIQIIEPGDEDATLVLVATGDLQVDTPSKTLVARAGAGDVVGEHAFYGDGVRRFGVWTRGESRLLVIDRDGYQALRGAVHPLLPPLEERVIRCVEQRFTVASNTIAQHAADGAPVPSLGAPDSLMGRFFSLFSGGLSRAKVANVLAGHGTFRDVDDSVLLKLADSFEQVGVRAGEVLLSRGDHASQVCFIGAGAVDVVSVTGPGRGYMLGTLLPGEGFGFAAALQNADPSGVTIVARERTTLLTLDRLQWVELASGADEIGFALRTAAIRSGAGLLARAGVLLSGVASSAC